ncbi:MAG: glycosyltransferase [Robiginitomaculum sp.]|nr:glycosyltransferase [Robiginitomaculum sp.]
MKIVAMVPNSGARDVRVVKEARTLVDAGHRVDVIGIREPDHTSIAAILQENLIVHRVNWQASAFQRTTLILLLLTFLGAMLGLYLVYQLVKLGLYINATLGIGDGITGIWNSVTASMLAVWTSSEILTNLYNGRFDEIGLIGSFALLLGFMVLLVILAAGAWFGWRYVRPGMMSILRKVKALFTVFFEPAKSFSNFALDFADIERIHLGSTQFLFEMIGNEGLWPFFVNQLRNLAALIQYRSVHTLQTKRMVELALELEPELIYCHEVGTLKAGVIIKKKLGIPLIYDAHEMYDALVQGAPHILKRYKKLHEKYFSEVDAFVTVNETIADIYKETYPEIKKTVIIKNATPKAKLKPYDGRLHEAAKLPYGRKILLYQGGYSPNRGIESIVKAAPFLPDDWSVVLMGWGRLQEELEELIEEQAREWTKKTIDNIISELKRKGREKITSEARDILLSLSPATDVAALEQNIRAIYSQTPTENDIIEASEASNNTNLLLEETDPQWSQGGIEAQLGIGDKPSRPELVDTMKVRNRLVQRYINKVIKTLTQWDKAGNGLRTEIEVGVLKKVLLENIPRLDPENYEKVRMIPPAVQEQLPLWSQGATLGAIPYPNDGLNHWACSPNKLWEYPNAGVPILVSPVPELYKAVTHDGIGWVLPPDPSPQQIAMIIQELTDEQFTEAKLNCSAFIEQITGLCTLNVW